MHDIAEKHSANKIAKYVALSKAWKKALQATLAALSSDSAFAEHWYVHHRSPWLRLAALATKKTRELCRGA